MIEWQTASRRHARLWAARFFVVCFALRALIPTGFMPDFSAVKDGKISVVICTAQGNKTITVTLDGKPGHSQSKAHDICPFAAAPAAGSVPELIQVRATASEANVRLFPSQADLVIVRQAGPVLGSRGPPA